MQVDAFVFQASPKPFHENIVEEAPRLSLGSYGRPRMTEELKEIGLDVGHRRVGRLMRQNGISVVRTRKHQVRRDQQTVRGTDSYRGEDVVQTLEQVCARTGYPKSIRVDQGSEFVSRDFDLWAYQKGVTLDFSRPGKPTDNAFIYSFNGKFRAECLNTHWFMSLDDARTKWRTGAETTTKYDPTAQSGTNLRSR